MELAIRVLIADPQAMFRDALRVLVEMETDLSVVGEASTGDETFEQVRRLCPDVLLLDVVAPQFSGIEIVRRLSGSNDPVRTLVMTDGAQNGAIVTALKHGARGIVPKHTTPSLLVKAIRAVCRGEYWVGHENISHLVDHIKTPEPAQPESRKNVRLTARELEIVAWIVEGATNRDIAQKLSISEQTVKHHLTSVFGKLGVSNRLELALFAMGDGRNALESA